MSSKITGVQDSMDAFTENNTVGRFLYTRNIFSKSFTINHLNDESRHEVTRLFAYADNKKNQLTKHQHKHPFSPPRFQVLNTSRISTKYSQQCGFASNMVSMVRTCNRISKAAFLATDSIPLFKVDKFQL